MVSVKAGAYMVTGSGSGLTGTSDGGTFTASPFQTSQGTFSCRVTAITAVKAKSIPDQAKVCLMARSSLSSSAAYGAVEIALNGGGPGVHFQVRPVAGQEGASDQHTSNAKQATGLIGGDLILTNRAAPAVNYLVKPVWLKLTRNGATYTAFTSLDGQHWAQAGNPETFEAVGVWVGFFVTSHDTGHPIAATFDQIQGFTPPTTNVQVGA